MKNALIRHWEKGKKEARGNHHTHRSPEKENLERNRTSLQKRGGEKAVDAAAPRKNKKRTGNNTQWVT